MDDFPTLDKAALNAEIARALDELVADSRFHAARIKQSFAEIDERLRRHRAEEEERVRPTAASAAMARETPPTYGEVPQRLVGVEGRLADMDGRLDRIARTLTDIGEQMATKADLAEVRRTMATKIELEAMSDKIKMVADGYQTVNDRLDSVASLLKLRVVVP